MLLSAESFHALITGDRRGIVASLARAGLRVLSWPYGLGVRLRNKCFDWNWKTSFRAAVPVISVGNLTLGGTGKTPCVEYLAALVRDRLGRRPVILSRGYGRDAGHNDEAMVLEENLPDVPHLQGADRVALAMTAVEELDAEALILDDGFQHRRLKRDLDIVLLDSTRPLSKEAMFPRGLLREPVSGLRRADMVLFTRCDQTATLNEQKTLIQKRFPNLAVATSVHEPVAWSVGEETMSLDAFTNTPVAAFCGLGNPQAFRSTLNALGCEPREFRTFPDHHNYSRADVDDLRRWAGTLPPDAAVLTTQKDWVKLRLAELGGRTLASLRIGLKLTSGEEVLIDKLLDRVGEAPADVED